MDTLTVVLRRALVIAFVLLAIVFLVCVVALAYVRPRCEDVGHYLSALDAGTFVSGVLVSAVITVAVRHLLHEIPHSRHVSWQVHGQALKFEYVAPRVARTALLMLAGIAIDAVRRLYALAGHCPVGF